MFNATITAVEFDKATYRPGERLNARLVVNSQETRPIAARLVTRLSHGADLLQETAEEVKLSPDEQSILVQLSLPPEEPRGYGLDFSLQTSDGSIQSSACAAFDVLERWTQTPRYGFLSDFEPGRDDAAQTMKLISRYHINALQFYDWMYRHEQFLTSQEPYIDLMGRQLSRQTVDALVEAAHERGIAAMPYTAIYGASLAFFREHPDWGLYKPDGSPEYFGDNFMAIMDPRPDSPWAAHLLDQFKQVLQQTQFDGIHLDSYGDPKTDCDAQGECFDLAEPLAQIINVTHELVQVQRPNGAVVFNAVTNWPIETVAPSKEDIVYIEVWPPYTSYNDLFALIVQAQKLGGGKPVVLAAYIDPTYEYNVRLIDSLIFASGGAHIELGERSGEQIGMLADAYFPRYHAVSPTLSQDLQRLYDFSVRYQDMIGPRTQDVTQEYLGRIQISGVSSAPSAMKDKVWPIVRQANGHTTVNLINLLGLQNPDWKVPLEAAPTPLSPVEVKIDGVDPQAERIWFASPDRDSIAAQSLTFSQEGKTLAFELPSLAYWDMICIEWKK